MNYNSESTEGELEQVEDSTESLSEQQEQLELRGTSINQALLQLEQDSELVQTLKKAERELETEKQNLESKRFDTLASLKVIRQELDQIKSQMEQSDATLETLRLLGEDISESESILSQRGRWLEECYRRVEYLATILGENYEDIGNFSSTNKKTHQESIENIGQESQRQGGSDRENVQHNSSKEDEPQQDPMQALNQYMVSHNYGKEDFPIYSQDPEWKKLHSAVYPDFHQIADHELTYEEKINWISSSIGTSKVDAERIVHSMEQYSGNKYASIHWDTKAELQETKDILQVFDSVKVHPYRGVIYRGLSFESKRTLMKALTKGKGDWNEPGVTSFSASKTRAEEFACKKKWGLVLTCLNNKTAIPFRHMSLCSWEDEILSPGGHRNNGWSIDMDSLTIDRSKHIVYVTVNEK